MSTCEGLRSILIVIIVLQTSLVQIKYIINDTVQAAILLCQQFFVVFIMTIHKYGMIMASGIPYSRKVWENKLFGNSPSNEILETNVWKIIEQPLKESEHNSNIEHFGKLFLEAIAIFGNFQSFQKFLAIQYTYIAKIVILGAGIHFDLLKLLSFVISVCV